MSQQTIFYLRRKELIEIFLLVLVIGFFINITSQFVWDNFFVTFDFWTNAQIIIGFVSVSLLTYFVLYVLKSHKILQIAEFYLVRLLENNIPEESRIPNYKGLRYAQEALRRLGSKSATLDQKTTERWDCLVDTICLDLMEYVILKWMAQRYHSGWLYEKHLSLKAYSFEMKSNKKSTNITIEELPTEMKTNNIFFNSLGETNYRLILPPNTTFTREVARIHWANPTREIKLKNKYCSLTITFQNTWQIQRIPNEIEGHLLSNEGEFQTHYFQIQVEAKFNRFLSVTPWIDKYAKWVNDITKNLFDSFDWNQYVKKKTR